MSQDRFNGEPMDDDALLSQPMQTSVVYDQRTGEIVHIHHFVPTDPDDVCPTDEMAETALEMAETALKLAASHSDGAQRRSESRIGLGVAHFGRDLILNPEYNYRIDVENRRLIEETL
jgi:hypothetical protein